MQALFVFIQKLSALVMAALLADLLVPAGTMRKYARLACGMLVLHIMVAQVSTLLGRGVPDAASHEWAQLVGEIRALPADAGAEEARAAYRRQAENLVTQKARDLGMNHPAVAIAWDASQRAVAVILTESEWTATEEAEASIRAGVAKVLGLPVQAVRIQAKRIQKEGDGAP